jgi:CheY-like chemotaxis protein
MQVLVADDDADDRYIFGEAIREVAPHLHCTFVNDGDEVMPLLHQAPKQPEYIFLDVNMPRMTGVECLKRLKESDNLREIRVVIYSTTADTREINKYLQLGAYQFMQKPTNYRTLKQLLHDILNVRNSSQSADRS